LSSNDPAERQKLRVWIVQPGEPLPIDGIDVRLMRSGIIASMLRDRGHDVTWWASTFRHSTHEFRFNADTVVEADGIRLALLHSPGYKRNISLARLRDHHVYGVQAARLVKRLPVPDVIHCGYPPLEVCETMVGFGRRNNVPVVVDVRDMWPEAFGYVLQKKLRLMAFPALRYLDFRAKRMLRAATAIHGHTPHFRDYGLKKAGRRANSWDDWFPFGYNASSPTAEGRVRAEAFWDEVGVTRDPSWLTICFFGHLNTERGDVDLHTLVRGIVRATDSGCRVRGVFCGAGRLADAMIAEYGGKGPHIYFPGFVDASAIWELMRRSDLGGLPYLPSRDFANSLPNKSIEYLAGGLPVLTSLVDSYLQKVLSEAECIVCYQYSDVEALAASLARVSANRADLARMSNNASRLFQSKFRSDMVYGRLVERLESLARTHTGRKRPLVE
jgi:glycosyltransferase involved in cell wall biosynthesis